MADEPVMPADVAGLVARLRAMSPDDRTRACVAVNTCVNNDLAKRLFTVLHAAPKAAAALEAQAAELAMWREVKHSSPRLEIIETELTAERAAHEETIADRSALADDVLSLCMRLQAAEARLAALTGPAGDMRDYHEGIVAALMSRAEAAETKLTAERAAHAEARKALDALDRMNRGLDWCDQDEQARRWSAARRALEGGEA